MFHPEIEILLVIRGTGTRIIGDSVVRFGPGDLIMIGPNVSHVYYSDVDYTKENSGLMSEAIFLLFKTEVFGDQFLNLPELKRITDLIQLSRRGIKLTGQPCKKITSIIMSLEKTEGPQRIIKLLSILEIISSLKEYQFLSSHLYQNNINLRDSNRLNKVYRFVNDNFYNEITIEMVSEIANLSKSAFCHYFKKRTNKTFIQFLTEIRISFSCRLLKENNQSVEEICYLCGFSNVSYFIRKFKEITGFTPLNYRNKFSYLQL